MDFHKEKYNKDVKEKERLKTKVLHDTPSASFDLVPALLELS